MSWETGRPIYHRLPLDSGSWQGNQIVDWVTDYWDGLLTQTKSAIDQPDDWLGGYEQLSPYFIDWVGYGLCGYSIWSPDWDDRIKRLLIRDWLKIVPNRGTLESCQLLIDHLCDGVVSVYDYPRADLDRADAAWCANDIPQIYHIGVPKEMMRNSPMWQDLERIKQQWFPSGARESRVQYQIAMADYAVAGDATGSFRSYQYEPTN
jgi:hypothetical protein